MAHFAEVDENGTVVRVVVVEDDKCLAPDGSESEEVGAAYCASLLGGNWLQTSYNGRIRKNFAGVGHSYDESLDAFVPPQPFPSWFLDIGTCRWEPPLPRPEGDGYYWDETVVSWVPVAEPVAE